MSRSNIGYAFLGVLFAHAALIAIFLTADRAPVARPVQSAAVVAQLLSLQDDAMPVAVQSAPQPPAKQVHQEPERQRVNKPPSPLPPQRAPAAAHAMLPAPVASPAQPSQPATSTPSAAPRTATASASVPAAAAPAARETLAIAAPKHVEHAECRIVKPTYPELSKRRDETGTAAVRFVIGVTGAIESVALVKSSGFGRLDGAALDALHASTCQPYVESGSPIRVSYTQAFTFGLDDD